MINGNYTPIETIILIVIGMIGAYWVSYLIHSYNPTNKNKED